MKSIRPPISRGRPRTFDPAKALDKALLVFLKNGYQGASLTDLTRAMGINRPSMYGAFGNKEELFRKALDRYLEKTSGPLQEALAQPTARQAVQSLLTSIVTKPAPGNIRGCLLVQGALACNDSAASVRRELATRRCAIEHALCLRLERAVTDGDLSRTADPPALAKFFATFQHGLAVQLAGGADRKDLLSAVDIALRALPD